MTVHHVQFDRGGVADAVARAQERSCSAAWDEARRALVFDIFLGLLRTAVARWQRGERLSARRYLTQFATDALLGMVLELSENVPAAAARDPGDLQRRIERQQPQLAAKVDALLCRAVPEGAVGMLELAEAILGPHWAGFPKSRAVAVRAILAAAAATPDAG